VAAFLPAATASRPASHPLEAIAHALCELIERDAVTLFNILSDAQRDATRLDLDSVHDPDCRAVIERCRGAGMALEVFDATSDIAIPTLVCLLAEVAPDAPALLRGVAIGSGCHPDPAIALLRAVTEAAQIRLAYISGARDDLPDAAYGRSESTDRAAEDARPAPTPGAARPFGLIAGFHGETFADDVAWIIDRLLAQGFDQVIAVDLAKPAPFAIPVVRLVVPGLEGVDDHPRYRPGERARALFGSQS
jgi:YcaO-like protein with predicted kinase domain